MALSAALIAGATSLPATAELSAAVSSVERPGRDAVGEPAIQLAQAQRNNLAREQAIIWRLEEEIRRLNGRIEELEYGQRQTDQRLEQLERQLEEGRLVSNTDGQGSTEPTFVEQTARSPEEALQDLAAQAEEGSLGRIPESAVANLQRPDPADIKEPDKADFSAEKQYENAVRLLRSGDYQGAQNGLETFLDIHQSHQLASNAAYWLAETHYVRQNYTASAAEFARNYSRYGRDAPKAMDNLLKLGMSLANLGQMEQACLTYDELNSTFPNTPAHIQQAVNRERARAQCG